MNGPPGSQVVPKKSKRRGSKGNSSCADRQQSVTLTNSNRKGNDADELSVANALRNAGQVSTSLFQPPRQEHVYVAVSSVSELYEQLCRSTSSAASASSGASNRNRKQASSEKRRTFTLHYDFAELPYPRGMVNNSNFCFMNSILQSLLFIPAFAQLAVSASCDVLAREACPTLAALGKWALQYWKPGYTRLAIAAPPLMQRHKRGHGAAIPSSQRALDGSVQEDAQEFLQKLLECIQQELVSFEEKLGERSEVASTAHSDMNSLAEESGNAATTQKGWTVVKGKDKLTVREHMDAQGQSRLLNAVFGGTLESHLQGKQRQRDHVSVLVEKYFCLPVGIAFAPECTMEQALEHTFTAEKIYDSEREKNLKKTLRLGHLPSILLIQLRRWAMTREGNLVKLDNVVHLRRTLEIPRSICSDETLSNAGRSYRLLSAVCHRGDAMSRGHYVTYLVHHAASPEVMKVQTTSKGNEAQAVRSAPPTASVILCNDTNISVGPAKNMEKETVYFLVYQKMS
ncbi:putative ubiquitin hydrolase putative cysteine peptidase Clan CA family C19 [Leptomonas seymouri]|uniref:Putative ubiquitin hydrolase putative cysteine peptidase Clan CA family C19 n=1 Tax=Leptomonas seymouri TaxID=5684 RepID=A0A0N1IMP3_LEPSE|nr:putative ubiquitin hydrolase putative cysteine peptidase Clan CA family C19 [Leptomonas seymouri]|eukprot:KPI90840.1 putative ubiquitin hydrolase putative cysteine peptidase Clan CA family C19 [Leptomonas seymouri]